MKVSYTRFDGLPKLIQKNGNPKFDGCLLPVCQ